MDTSEAWLTFSVTIPLASDATVLRVGEATPLPMPLLSSSDVVLLGVFQRRDVIVPRLRCWTVAWRPSWWEVVWQRDYSGRDAIIPHQRCWKEVRWHTVSSLLLFPASALPLVYRHSPTKRRWEASWSSSQFSLDMQATATPTHFNVVHDFTPFLTATRTHVFGSLGRDVNH